MMKTMNQTGKGFTLIELLVVIAIIGVLSAVVLSSLNTARTKSYDASVKSNLAAIRPQAQLYYEYFGRYASATGSYYAGNCLTQQSMFRETIITGEAREVADKITASIAAAFSAGNGTKQCRIDAARQNYMIAIGLRGSNTYWCIDNAGTAKDIGATLPADGVIACP